MLVGISVWAIFATTYAEFVYWRALRLLQGSLRTIESLIYDATIGNSGDETDLCQKQPQENMTFTRKMSLIALWIWTLATLLRLVLFEMARNRSRVSEEWNWRMYYRLYFALNCLLAVQFVLSRAVITRRLYQFARTRILFGVLYGFLEVPCIFCFTWVRKFENLQLRRKEAQERISVFP